MFQGKSYSTIGIVVLICLSLSATGLISSWYRNRAFLHLSEALLIGNPNDAAERAKSAQLSLEILRNSDVINAVGISLVIQGKDKDALSLWQQSGMTSRALMQWGAYYEENKSIISALRWYKLATELAPSSSESWYALGLHFRKHEEWQDALFAQSKSIELNSEDRDVWYEMAWANLNLGNYEQALKAFQFGINAKNGKIGISILYYYKGYLRQFLLKPDDVNGALLEYQKALNADDFKSSYWSLRNLKSSTHYQIGNIQSKLGRNEIAISEYETAIFLDAENYPSFLALANAKWAQGNSIEAIQLIEKAISIAPKRVNAYYMLGDFYQEKGDLDKARGVYHQILDIDSNETSAKRQLEKIGE